MWNLLVGSSLVSAVIGFVAGFYWNLIRPAWLRMLGAPDPAPEEPLPGNLPPRVYTPALMDELALLERHVTRLELRTRTWLVRLFLLGVIGVLVMVIFLQRGVG